MDEGVVLRVGRGDLEMLLYWTLYILLQYVERSEKNGLLGERRYKRKGEISPLSMGRNKWNLLGPSLLVST